MIRVEEVSADQTLSLRLRVLRPDLPLVAEQIEYAPESARHFAALDGDSVVGACYILFNAAPFDESKRALQLRGMAVESERQSQGIGALIVRRVELEARRENIEIVWFNARKIAVGFYQKLNFELRSAEFDIEGVGPHFVMGKRL